MKKQIIKFTILLLIIISLLFTCACGGVNYEKTPKSIYLFHGQRFTLPVPSIVGETPGSPTINQDTSTAKLVVRKNTKQLYTALSSASKGTDTYTLLEDIIYFEVETNGSKSSGIITHVSNDKIGHHYVVHNLYTKLIKNNVPLPIMTPNHLMEDFSKTSTSGNVTYSIADGKEYQIMGNIDDFQAFYTTNGYSVTKESNKLLITDTSLSKLNAMAIDIPIPESIAFEITFTNGYATYSIL